MLNIIMRCEQMLMQPLLGLCMLTLTLKGVAVVQSVMSFSRAWRQSLAYHAL